MVCTCLTSDVTMDFFFFVEVDELEMISLLFKSAADGHDLFELLII
jgi:hypothetical protein